MGAKKRFEQKLQGHLNGLDFEVEGNQREDETPQVLNKVVKDTKTFGILTILDVDQRTHFSRLKSNMIIADPDFKLLLANNILLWPVDVVFLCDITRLNDALELFDNERADPHFFANQAVVTIVRVVGIT